MGTFIYLSRQAPVIFYLKLYGSVNHQIEKFTKGIGFIVSSWFYGLQTFLSKRKVYSKETRRNF